MTKQNKSIEQMMLDNPTLSREDAIKIKQKQESLLSVICTCTASYTCPLHYTAPTTISASPKSKNS